MKIFLSWSKDLGKEIAEILNEVFPTIIQDLQFFYSPDIEKGADWDKKITEALETCQFGIIIITSESKNEPWLNYEAGAIALKLENEKTATFAVDLAASDIQRPLAKFQLTMFNREDIFKLIQTLNNTLIKNNGLYLSESRLKQAFEDKWNLLNKTILNKINIYNNKNLKTKNIFNAQEVLLNDMYNLLKDININTREKSGSYSNDNDINIIIDENRLIKEYIINITDSINKIQNSIDLNNNINNYSSCLYSILSSITSNMTMIYYCLQSSSYSIIENEYLNNWF